MCTLVRERPVGLIGSIGSAQVGTQPDLIQSLSFSLSFSVRTTIASAIGKFTLSRCTAAPLSERIQSSRGAACRPKSVRWIQMR